jgi:hypothetical protein
MTRSGRESGISPLGDDGVLVTGQFLASIFHPSRGVEISISVAWVRASWTPMILGLFPLRREVLEVPSKSVNGISSMISLDPASTISGLALVLFGSLGLPSNTPPIIPVLLLVAAIGLLAAAPRELVEFQFDGRTAEVPISAFEHGRLKKFREDASAALRRLGQLV